MKRLIFIFIAQASFALAQSLAPPLLQPDPRYKADVLVVVAHPDDDVLIGGYLARISLDEHKRVAVIYCTNGDGGGNDIGNEAGAALGQLRLLEARRALASLGIENVWFLGGHDTPGQNVLRSLDNWNHGLALDEIVRLVRITRPEVVLTWLPDYVAGENHEDHQASSVLASEAFDLAADPTWFPEQVSPPRDRVGMSNLTEGLLPWQPQKLYFFTDAFENFTAYWSDPTELPAYRKTIIDGTGPTYDTTTISPSRHVSYAQIEAEQQAFYRTQEGSLGVQAITKRNFKDFEFPIHLIFGKSVVGGSVAGDVFEGVSRNPVPFARVRGYVPESQAAISFEIGDPWRFYSLFWKAHNLDRLAGLIPEPELAARYGDKLIIPLMACNNTAEPVELTVTPTLPPGWSPPGPIEKGGFTRFPLRPGECYPIQSQIIAPASGIGQWQQLTLSATAGALQAGVVIVHVYLNNSGGLPQ
jgi:LmbE family N-acetylglucosaminyl deacetylase